MLSKVKSVAAAGSWWRFLSRSKLYVYYYDPLLFESYFVK